MSKVVRQGDPAPHLTAHLVAPYGAGMRLDAYLSQERGPTGGPTETVAV